MTCTHCGQEPASDCYTLRFDPEEREPVNLDLVLCEGCLGAFLSEDGIELDESTTDSSSDTSPSKGRT